MELIEFCFTKAFTALLGYDEQPTFGKYLHMLVNSCAAYFKVAGY
jgi:hypothetical protein